jgi:hypothetical protein
VDRIETNVSYATEYAQRALTNVNQAKRAKNRNIKVKLLEIYSFLRFCFSSELPPSFVP